MVVKERRKLGMHENMIYHTIKRQCGTLEKANVEGVMNAIEAGGTSVHIDLMTGKNVAILNLWDNGKGFKDEDEVENFFATFGTPHEESEHKIYAQFRIGRGQMFAYGKNIWRTGQFRMTVDVKNWGLEYEFESGLPFYKGCAINIELYKNPIGIYPYYSMADYKEAIEKQVRFVEVPVFFNQEQANTPPSKCNWDAEDNKAYYLFNTGTDMKLYNLGIYVQTISANRAGMNGIVVSKKQLLVNQARNDVDSTCLIMAHINEILKENFIKKTRQRRRTFEPHERQAALIGLRNGQQDLDDLKTIGLIPTAQGKHVSIDFIRKNKQQWSFAEHGSDLADRLMEREQALVLDESILSQLNYGDKDPRSFFSWLTGTNTSHAYGNHDWKALEKLYVDFETLSNGVSDDYCTLSDKKMTVPERRIIKVLNSFSCWNGRVINLGYSERANAWTNGCTYITIDRSFLKRLYMSYNTHVNKLMWVMAHEMAHDCDTRGTHYHGPEFYENMVQILGSPNSPTAQNCTFYAAMQKSKIEEKRAKIDAQVAKAEAKTDKKLGIAASAKS